MDWLQASVEFLEYANLKNSVEPTLQDGTFHYILQTDWCGQPVQHDKRKVP